MAAILSSPIQRKEVPGRVRAGTRLWLIRHAEVETRYQGVFGGQIDMDLSPRGQLQAQALADYFRNKHLDAFYASPMLRVQQTIAPLTRHGLLCPVTIPEFREVNFGAWTGLTFEQVREQFGFSAWEWLEQLECAGIPDAECARSFRGRIEPHLRRILEQHKHQDVAIACHGGVIRGLLSLLLDLPLAKTGIFQVEYASITQVLLRPEQTELELLNFTPWRDLSL